MRMADIVEAVLQKNKPELQAAFRFLVVTKVPLTPDNPEVQAALLTEVCTALADDQDDMHESLCRTLEVPLGSTFAQGARKVIEAAQTGAGQSPPGTLRH